MKIRRKWRQKGAVLPYIIIIFFIGTVIAGIIYSYSSNNIKQTVQQQKYVLAYYCTLTGINMAAGALLMDNHSLFTDLVSNPRVVTQEISVPVQGGGSGSSAAIVITCGQSKPNTNTKTITPGDANWIQVQVTGKYLDGAGKVTTNVGSVYYRMNNPFIYEQQLDAVY